MKKICFDYSKYKSIEDHVLEVMSNYNDSDPNIDVEVFFPSGLTLHFYIDMINGVVYIRDTPIFRFLPRVYCDIFTENGINWISKDLALASRRFHGTFAGDTL